MAQESQNSESRNFGQMPSRDKPELYLTETICSPMTLCLWCAVPAQGLNLRSLDENSQERVNAHLVSPATFTLVKRERLSKGPATDPKGSVAVPSEGIHLRAGAKGR